MSNSRQIAALPNILTLIDDAGGQFIKQQAAGVTTSYTITWPSAVGSSGAVLALTDGSGGLGWQSTLGIALSGGTVNNSIIGGSTPAAITGTTITANTAFVGPLTGNSTTATALAAGRTFAFTGDATGTSASFDGSANVSTSLTLAASGVSAASYGSATAIPVLTIDAKGRVTAATTASISSTLTVGADSGSNDTVTIGTDTLNFVGTGSEIETTVSNNQIQIGLPSTVSGLTTVSATNLQGALAGTIASTTTGATQAASDNSTKIATTAYVTTALANLVDSAPAALGDDASFSTTVTNSIATKLALAGGTMTGNLILNDNVKALFGTGSDLEIYHDGSNSYIVDAGTGGILYRGGTQTFQNAAGSKTMAVLNGATSVDLYYNDSKKFETTAAGVTITGTGSATTFSATTLTGTLSTAAQPNITSVGTLTSLNISGNLDATVTTPAQPNITSVGTLTSLNVSGTATANAFSGPLTGNVTGNVSGSAATVTGAAQTAITSVGTLSALVVSGDVTIDTSTLKVDTSNNRVGILNASPDVTLDIGSATDSIHIPVGTTAQRPGSPAAGYFRYNSSLSQFEGYTSAWGAIGGGGTNTFNHNVFTGNGSTTAFALAAATESENNLLVFIDGVFQEQGAYSIATSGGTTTLTMSAAPASGRKLVVYQVSAGVSGNNLNIDTMTGDGSDTTLTLSINPVNENNVQVFFDGVYQNKSTFSVSGTTLTFSTAPPTGVEVEAMTFTQTEVNVPVNDTIDTVHIKDNAVTVGKLAASLNLSSNTITLPAVAIPSASTATTQSASDNSTKVATTEYVTTAIAALIDGAPGTLNTLNELAAALADDAAFSSTLTTSLAAKANLTGATFTGNSAITKETPVFTLTDSSASRTLALIVDDNNSVVRASGPLLLQTGGSTSAITIDASQNVGIGTASPARSLSVNSAGTQIAASFTSTSSTSARIGLVDANTTGDNYVNVAAVGNAMALYAGAAERMRITSGGNVGIGITPSTALHVVGTTTFDGDGSSRAEINSSTASSIVSLNVGGFTGTPSVARDVRFFVNAAANARTERMRIDSSGNLLVGKTTTALATAGLTFGATGFASITRDGLEPLSVNRLTSNGTLAQFYKDGSAVGHIGTTGGKLYIGSPDGSDAFLRFESNEISPCAHEGSFRDAVISLGKTASRFKDLYLSGTATIGTNGSEYANNYIRFKPAGDAYIDHQTVGQKLRFRVSNSSSLDTTPLVLTSSGNVGVGTDSPAKLFHVSAGTSASTVVRFGQNFDTNVEIGPVSATASGMITFLNASGTAKVAMGFRDSGSGSDGAFRIRRAATLDAAGAYLNFGLDGSLQLQKSAVSSKHVDSFAALIVEDTEARLQLISANTGDEASSLLLTNVNKHWGIVNHGPDQSNRFAIGYHESSSSGTDIANALSDAVTITTSFDVGVGRVPSSGFRLDVNDSNSGTANLLRLRNSSTGGSATAKMLFSLNRTGSSIDFEAGSIEVRKDNTWTTASSSIDSHMRFMTVQNESVAEKMRIASNGTTTMYGGVYSVTGATSGMFFTGTTDPFSFQKSGSHGYINNAAGGNIYMRMGSGFTTTFTYTSGGNLYFNQGDRINYYGSNFYVLNDNNVGVRLIDGNTAWQTQSDERTKENITDIGSVLSKIKDYRCVEYNLKSQDRKMYGLIAQDWETDFPHLVDEDDNFTVQSDGTTKPADEEGNTSTDAVKTLSYNETIPVLLKAIQEQQALIEALQTKVAALEGE